MRRQSLTVKTTAFLVASCLLPLLPPLAPAQNSPASPRALVGRILTPDGAQVVVRREAGRCDSGAASPDLVLLTLGTESEQEATPHFHPLAALAFDRTLADHETGQWLALWTFGPSAAGWRRNLHASLPLPTGNPRASDRELARLEEQIGAVARRPEEALEVPEPVVHLANLGRASASQGVWGTVRRGLAWTGVVNPAQFVFRSYLLRRKDRRERDFLRAYLALQWLHDLEFNHEKDPRWVATLNELRFHLLRNRSFFGRFIPHAEANELVYNYESDIRVQLGKSSSWLQSAANEHALRYEPIYRYSENSAAFPMGGVLYYDPSLGAEPDPGWWSVANPFDLPYNPHTHTEVQRLARAHPDELIPLAVYTFRTNLRLRPTIVVDFFAPGNPRGRERTHQLMLLAKQWVAITTSWLGPGRLPYALLAWSANKKGFTYLVDKSSRLGVEEMRLALEAGLYFDPELRQALLERVDQRVFNPLVKAGGVEERLAHLQYESLRAQDATALCRRVNEVRQKMMERLGVPGRLAPQEQRKELARRLRTWHHQMRLENFVSQPLEDFGSLGALEGPLRYFLEAPAAETSKLEKVLAQLYAKLFLQQLLLPPGRAVPELDTTLALTRQVWQRAFPGADAAGFEAHRGNLERQVRARWERDQKAWQKKRIEELRGFLRESHKQLEWARKSGCRAGTPLPSELEAHLVLLQEVARAAYREETLRTEFERQAPQLRDDLQALERVLARCTPDPTDPWRAEVQQSCLDLARSLQNQLAGRAATAAAGGG